MEKRTWLVGDRLIASVKWLTAEVKSPEEKAALPLALASSAMVESGSRLCFFWKVPCGRERDYSGVLVKRTVWIRV